jgi:hypothetical protein
MEPMIPQHGLLGFRRPGFAVIVKELVEIRPVRGSFLIVSVLNEFQLFFLLD